MNQFLDEISNRNKPEASLRLWTKALIRIILEKRLPITSFLAISTLKKAPWLFSESHLKIFDLFEKFLLTVLSLYNQHLPLVYKYLFEQILFEEKLIYNLKGKGIIKNLI